MYYRKKTLSRCLICRKEYYSSEMKAFLQNVDLCFDDEVNKFIKKAPGEATTVSIITMNNKKFVIKRYNPKGFWHGLKRMLRESRALRSWKNSHYLERQGIATAKPVAVLIERFGFIRGKTYYLMEFVDGLRGWDIFKPDSDYRSAWDKILNEIACLLEKLHAAKVTHDDFQHNNMLFVNETPVLLDLDHMRIHKYNSLWFRHNFRKDIDNFLMVLGETNPDARQMAAARLGGKKNLSSAVSKPRGNKIFGC